MGKSARSGWTRRRWLRTAGGGAAASWLAPLIGCDSRPRATPWRHFDVPGEIIGRPVDDAHRMRDSAWATTSSADIPADGPLHDCIIVGSGVAGCTAAWKLRRAGVHDYVVLELGTRVGGTSAWGETGESAYPWAAHYVTTPPAGADCLIEVLTDLGVLAGVRDEDGWPIGNPAYVVRHPVERLRVGTRWTNDIMEMHGTDATEQQAMRAMQDALFAFMRRRDAAERPALTLPVAYSSPDPEFTQLDRGAMRSWMREHGFSGKRLEWNVDYACRDDYGSTAAGVSAWAGIHYHVCRFNDDRYRYHYPVETFTWPEGNGFLVKGLLSGTPRERIRTGMMVTAIENQDDHVAVTTYDRRARKLRRLTARRCIFAGKLHVLPYVMQTIPAAQREAVERCTYAPWLVAQVHVKRLPRTQGSTPAWDNVRYESESLGYVVANHQTRWALGPQREHDQPTVLTYYHPFVQEPEAAREALLEQDHAHWVDLIMNDLAAMHPEIGSLVTRIDVMLYGHAMIVPTPGFIWSADRGLRSAAVGRVHLAGADASGLPLYEEAVFHGIRAAEEVLDGLGRRYATSLANWKKA